MKFELLRNKLLSFNPRRFYLPVQRKINRLWAQTSSVLIRMDAVFGTKTDAKKLTKAKSKYVTLISSLLNLCVMTDDTH